MGVNAQEFIITTSTSSPDCIGATDQDTDSASTAAQSIAYISMILIWPVHSDFLCLFIIGFNLVAPDSKRLVVQLIAEDFLPPWVMLCLAKSFMMYS